MNEKKNTIANTLIPQTNYRKQTSKLLANMDTAIIPIGKNHREKDQVTQHISDLIDTIHNVVLNKKNRTSKLKITIIDTLFQTTTGPIPSTFDALWKIIQPAILNTIKVHYLSYHIDDLLFNFDKKLTFLVTKYKRHLPYHISLTEGDDLATIAQLELIETFKAWQPIKNPDVWPLAYTRVNGAMKDHIRYISKSDPTRFYDWVVDAANLYLAVNNDNSHESTIENSAELDRALSSLTQKEANIVTLYINDDLTFKEISKKLHMSESQISRIYKAATKKIKTILI
ncbi:MAG: sigma-70 family RNA polymerase sigma factor [Candidatus Marinamargulisbacteria bacterium]